MDRTDNYLRLVHPQVEDLISTLTKDHALREVGEIFYMYHTHTHTHRMFFF